MTKGIVLSLYDFTGEAVRPWALAGYSTQHLKLGGKSQRTKDIRSATPRGFAIAVYEANKETT